MISRGVFVLWTRGLMNQFLKNHQLNKAEFGVTDESISVRIRGSQDTFFSSSYNSKCIPKSEYLYFKPRIIVQLILFTTYFQYFAASLCSTHPPLKLFQPWWNAFLAYFAKYRICAQLVQILLHSSLFQIFIWYLNSVTIPLEAKFCL